MTGLVSSSSTPPPQFKFGVKRERAPFVLTPDFVYVMGKKGERAGTDFEFFCF
jgi:hypothetical protein